MMGMKKRVKRVMKRGGGSAMKKRVMKRGGGSAMKKRVKMKKGGKSFPDLTGDGKVTRKDILKGRGVKLKRGGTTSVSKGNPHKRTRIEKLKELNKSKKIKTLRRDLVKKNKLKAV